MLDKFKKETISIILYAEFLFHFFGNYQLSLATLVKLKSLTIDQKDVFSKFLLHKKIENHLKDLLVNAEDDKANEYGIHIVIKVEEYYKNMISLFKEICTENLDFFDNLSKEKLDLQLLEKLLKKHRTIDKNF